MSKETIHGTGAARRTSRLSFARIASFRRTGCARRRRSLPFPPHRLCEHVDDARYACWLLGKLAGGDEMRLDRAVAFNPNQAPRFCPVISPAAAPETRCLSSCRCAVSGYGRCYIGSSGQLGAQRLRSRPLPPRHSLDAAVMEEDVCRFYVFRALRSGAWPGASLDAGGGTSLRARE